MDCKVVLYFPRLDAKGVVMDWPCLNKDRVFRLLWEVCGEELGKGDRMPIAINEVCAVCDKPTKAVGLCDEHYQEFETYTCSI